MPSATLVLTTIYDPVILHDYRENFARHGHLDDVEVIVIPDLKTPAAVYETCGRLATQGLKVTCPAVEEQNSYLKRIGVQPEVIPCNSDNRRNVGYLMALERQSDFLISIDDDNYCLPAEDYFGVHADVLSKPQQHTIVSSPTRFFNICELLEFNTAAPVYPRGYPYYARHEAAGSHAVAGNANVWINAGLWLNDPDVDAITWLGLHPSVRSFKNRSAALDAHTWAPVNSQNTALRTEVIPSYYFIRMGYPVHGMAIDRYGDIFSGYFALACVKHLGGTARFGSPVVDHRRNSHNHFHDAFAELPAIRLLEDLLGWLTEARLSGSGFAEAYLSLSYGLEDAAEKFHGTMWNNSSRGFFHQMGYLMRAWLSACDKIASTSQIRTNWRLYEDQRNYDGAFGIESLARIGAADPEPVAEMAVRDPDGSTSKIH